MASMTGRWRSTQCSVTPYRSQHPIEDAFHRAIEEAVLFAFALAQEAAAQHRRQADGHHSGDQNGGADGDGEFAEQAAQNAGHEQNRNEDRGQRERHRDDGEADLPRTGERRLHGRLAHFDVADDVLQHHDGVVHHEADGEDQRHHGDVVEAEIQQVHHREGADDGERQRHRRESWWREKFRRNRKITMITRARVAAMVN